MSSKKTINCAIIGCGIICPTHIESFQSVENVKVLYLCDLVESKAKALAAKYGIDRTSDDYKAVIADPAVDCVSICTDHYSHAHIAMDALAAGKHVLSEKALAANKTDLLALLRQHARRPELVFSGVFQHRFDPIMRELKRLRESGVFGTILNVEAKSLSLRDVGYYTSAPWRGTWKYEGGSVLINQSIHTVDLVTWIMGGVAAVCGVYDNLTHRSITETEDVTNLILRFKDGSIGTIFATNSSKLNWETVYAIHGSEGSVEIRDYKVGKVLFVDKVLEKKVREELNACEDKDSVRTSKFYYGASHPRQVADFVAAIRENRAPFVTGESAAHTVEVVLSLYESSREARWIKVNGSV
jgi:UDP-N-acetyl-2-amino-2-deoxyglucuronate dehydrogenase